MKKKMICLIIVSLMFFCSMHQVEAVSLAKEATGAILMDCDSGQILFSKNETKKLYPAYSRLFGMKSR